MVITFAVLALVLVGMLFGFNIQINADATSFLASIGSLVGGLAAAVAAFFSYRSVGEWRNQMQHSLLYEHLSHLETLLNEYVKKVNKSANNIDEIPVYKVLNIASQSARDVREEYESNYQKIHELIPTHLKVQLEELHFLTLTYQYNIALHDYKVKSSSLSRYISENKEKLEEASFDELSREESKELIDMNNAALAHYDFIMSIGGNAKISLSELRASLLKKV
ncbi:hypothetical protein [Vibrio sp. 10N.261.52.A1]|uniref:hypothetical protein n=1 Tax=Vibrio TaxID=662 RepID=UPI000C856EB9|nr:hypothetical protein [Vibrio sp. 10N.261.52.A1]PML55818.1 hypothetical protein BCT81_08830 [Vibrio sp. 10N.261.52.A1]